MVADLLGVGVLAAPIEIEDVALGDDPRALALGIHDHGRAHVARRSSARPPRAACGPGRPSGPPCSCPSRTCIARPPASTCSDSHATLCLREVAIGARDPLRYGMSGNAPSDVHGAKPGHPDGVARAYPSTCPPNVPPPSATARACSRTPSPIVEREYASRACARRHRPPRRLVAPPAPARVRRDRRHDVPRPPDPGPHAARRRDARERARMTVREVAHRVGYRQPAQFAKAFRRHQGSRSVGLPARRRGRLRAAGRLSSGGAAGAAAPSAQARPSRTAVPSVAALP